MRMGQFSSVSLWRKGLFALGDSHAIFQFCCCVECDTALAMYPEVVGGGDDVSSLW